MKRKRNQVTLDLHPNITAEATAIAEAMSQPGIEVTQTDVLRAAIVRGLEALRKVRR